ncbi:MAG: ORF6N domain-containing protein [Bdellovibrionales bacterium]|nr:ORF6N domain-containing protein [Bdellovibrionales bacterium]
MENTQIPLTQKIQAKIHVIRGLRVMLDIDLAELYGVETKVLNQAVKRNVERFPADFMFQLAEIDGKNLRSQIVTSSLGYGGRRYLPFAFTEQGIAMLSSVLRSETAIQVNIEIMRAFVKMKALESENHAIWQKIDQLEKKYDANFSGVFEAIRQIMAGEPPNQHRKIKSPSE